MITIRLESPVAAIVYCETTEEAETVLAALTRPRPIQVLQTRPCRVPEPKVEPAAEVPPPQQEPEQPVSTEPPEAEDAEPEQDERGEEQESDEPVQSPHATSELPPIKQGPSGRRIGVSEAVLAAFRQNQSYPLPKLAKHVYGAATGGSLNMLKFAIRDLQTAGKLARLGATSWKVTE